MTSLFQLYLTYITVVVGFREVLLWEILLLSTLFAVTVLFLFRTRLHLNKVTEEDGQFHARKLKTRKEDEPIILEYDVTWIDSRPIISAYCSLFILFVLFYLIDKMKLLRV